MTGRRPALIRLLRDSRGASAVEFALVVMPFLLMVLGTLQVAIYYMTQTSLDAGVNNTADYLRSQFASASPTFPNAATLTNLVWSKSGGLIQNNSSLLVEIQPLTNLDGAAKPVVANTNLYGGTTTTLVLRAQASMVTFVPLGALSYVRSTAIVRRKGS